MKLQALFFMVMLAGSLTTASYACSIMPPQPEDVRNKMLGELANYLNIAVAEINSFDLTEPKLTFLKPIGADCSGLDTGFHAAAYHFEKTYPNMSCTHQGVIILTSWLLNGNVKIDDQSTCLGNPISISQLDGTWVSMSGFTTGLTRLDVTNGSQQVQIFRKCFPDDCDLGSHPLSQINQNTYETNFIDGSKQITVTIVEKTNDQLTVTFLEKNLTGNGYKKKTSTFKRL